MARKKSSKKKPVEALPADIGDAAREADPVSGSIVPKRNSLRRILLPGVISEEQFADVVAVSLSASRIAGAKSARQSLHAAIDASDGIKVKGFSQASRAKAAQLQEPVMDECMLYGNERLLGAVMRMWLTCKPELRSRVAQHLVESGIETRDVDFKDAVYAGIWRPEDWDRHLQSLVEAVACPESGNTAEAEFETDELRLMFSLLTSAVPAHPGEIVAVDIESPMLSNLLESLWTALPTREEWQELDKAIEALTEINEQKSRQMIEMDIRFRRENIEFLVEEFKEELEYLDEFNFEIVLDAAENPEILLTVDSTYPAKLILLLERYRDIRPQAKSRSAEKARAAERSSLEDEAIDLFAHWLRDISRQQEIIRERLDAEQQTAAEAGEAEAGASPANEESRDEELESLREKLQEEKSAHKALQGRYDKQGEDKRKWERQSSKLEKDKQRLEEEIESLRALQGPNADAANQQGVSGVREEAGEYRVNYSPDRIKDVKDAFSQSQRTYSEELVFAPNSKSEHSNSAFEKPDEVFKALAWLAFEFRDSKLNPGIGENLNEVLEESLKNAVRPNWSYSPRQSMTAVGKYPDAYRTTYQGNKYDLHEHLKRGRSYDPKSNIRISFAWDEAIRKVVVGYIGRHQKTAQS